MHFNVNGKLYMQVKTANNKHFLKKTHEALLPN